jgi:hypothetical protein
MSVDRWLRGITIFVVGAAMGWIAAPDSTNTPPAPSQASRNSGAPLSSSLRAPRRDSVEFLPDGAVSIHAEHVTLAWLERELAQPGATLNAPRTDNRADESTVIAIDAQTTTPSDDPVDPERVSLVLRNGTAQDGIAALTRSLEQDVDVPVEVLRETVEFGASSEIRQLAFRMYVDAVSNDTESSSAALALGASSNDPNIRSEALARLAEFEQMRQATVPQSSE